MVETFTLTRSPQCPEARQLRHLTARFFEHPGPHPCDQTGLLGDRNEVAGRNRSVTGVFQPHQGLQRRDVSGGVLQRLIAELKIAAFQSLADQARDSGRAEIDPVHFGVEDGILVLVLRFATIHGHVGEAVQGRDIVAMLGKQTDADAGRSGQLESLDVIGFAQFVQNVAGHRFRFRPCCESRHKDREFIATEARQGVLFAYDLP